MDETRFVWRRIGLDGKTPEEIEDDRRRLFEACSAGGRAAQKRLKQIGESDMDDLSEEEIAFYFSMRREGGYTSGALISAATRSVNTNPLTASAYERALVEHHQANNNRKQAVTVAGVGMSVVNTSTRSNPIVECECVKCGRKRFSRHTIPSSKVGNSDRNIEECDVDENGNMIGEPVRIHTHLDAAAKAINSSKNTIRPIVNNSEDGGLLRAGRLFQANGKQRPPRWLRYVSRRPTMIVTPQCSDGKCNQDTKPTDADLQLRVDYVNYNPLKQKWRRAKAKELRELCLALGLVVAAGLSAAALQEKLNKHYNGDGSADGSKIY